MLSHSEAMAIQREEAAKVAAMKKPRLNGSRKTATEIMHQDIENTLSKSIAIQQQELMSSLLADGIGAYTSTSTGNSYKKTITVNRKVERPTSRSRVVSYPNGYWVKITINDNDSVSYKLFNSGWLAKAFHKIGFRKVLNNGWTSVKQRNSVEATLGATYMEIDEAIEEDMKKTEHCKFLKEMIKTDPENLKAIAQLDMLDKGDGPGSGNDQPDSGATQAPPTVTFSNNVRVSGTGAYYTKYDDSKPASIQTGQIDFKAGGANSLSFGEEEVIKVDPEGGISFGDKMASAIKQVVQTEKGDTDGS